MAMAGWAFALPYQLSDAPQVWIPKAAAGSGRLQISFILLLVFAVTALAGAIVTGIEARRASRRIGTAGLVLTFLGFAAVSFGGAGYDAAAVASYRVVHDVAQVERILAELGSFAAPVLASAVFVPLTALGVILMGIALWRGRAVPRWAAAAMIVAFPVILGGGAVSTIVNGSGWLLLAVGFGAAGVAYARRDGVSRA
ncbi:hypothetical protein ACFQ0B_42025 [Nonomuraea thailandensis]